LILLGGYSVLYKILVMLHLLGAATWIGGHVVLVRVVLPTAMRRRDANPVVEFERGFGRIGLGAMVVQLATGLWLATIWLGGWQHAFDMTVPSAPLVLTKLALMGATLALAGRAHHTLVPRLDGENLGPFAVHARIVLGLAVLLLVVGATVRLGRPF
jgi:putative copper export protein